MHPFNVVRTSLCLVALAALLVVGILPPLASAAPTGLPHYARVTRLYGAAVRAWPDGDAPVKTGSRPATTSSW